MSKPIDGAFLLLKYYKPNIPSEEYALYNKVDLPQVLPLLPKLKQDYSNFPEGESLSREQFEWEREYCDLIQSNASGEVWEYGSFGNKFKLARNECKRFSRGY